MVQERSLPSLSIPQTTITREQGLMLYEDMVLGRTFEDKCAEMYYRGRMFGFVHLYNGQEAVSTGVIKAMRPDDYVCSTYRDHVHALSAGVPAREVMAELFGKATGVAKAGAAQCTSFLPSIISWGALPLSLRGFQSQRGQHFRRCTAVR